MPICGLGKGYSQHMGATQSLGDALEGRPLEDDPDPTDAISAAAAAPEGSMPQIKEVCVR